MTENFKQFVTALRENEDLAKQFKAELDLIKEKNEPEDQKEAVVKAAGALGFDLTLADLEKAEAEARELDPEELEKVSGGGLKLDDEHDWCWFKEYWCNFSVQWV